MSKPTMLDHALALASQGFHVFPLESRSKVPLITDYPNRATRDPEQIKRWWTDPVMGWLCDYNIGISTTRFDEDKALVVVDVDLKDGRNGNDTILLFGWDLPPTAVNLTPTGGRHLIYVVNEPVKQGANVLGPGLDIRSRGGYIVGPGSIVEAGEYQWA